MDLNKLKSNIIKVMKSLINKIVSVLIPIILIIILICSFCYYLNIDDGIYKNKDMSNAPYAVSTYTGNVNVNENGQIVSQKTAKELWDEMKKNDNRCLYYLDSPEQLLKLMNAQLVTQFLDTRSNPDDPIDWDSMNDINSKNVQGIVKMKRADDLGNTSTMTYVDQETFQDFIDKYNSTGSEEDKKVALSHFTLDTITSSAYDNINVEEIKEGDVINVPKGLGSTHTYMGWQMITSPTSTQYRLRETAGMNFDEEGFGRINGRYVIACTTTFGTVGDYIDFFQEDGSRIPCIIGDIKNQNDNGCNKWGHLEGKCIIEFVVDKESWYYNGHGNPGTSLCHPEWSKNITKAVNGGNYFKNPEFGTDKVKEEKTVNDVKDSDAMKWPTDGTTITSPFGMRNAPNVAGATADHRGIDIGVPQGTNVYACEAGKVITASFNSSAGNWIIIDHGNGYVSKYMHNSQFKVKVGDIVKKGQVIALSGSTGASTGPHVHFQIEYQGNPIDPLSFKFDNGQGTGTGGCGNDVDSTNDLNSNKNTSNKEKSKTKYCAKVATWNEKTNKIESNDPTVSGSEERQYNMTTTNINYKDLISNYTMPFEYLWAFLVISEDKDMVLELANLVYNSEIEITVHDNLKVTTDVLENTYTKKKKTNTSASVVVKYGKDENNISGSTRKNEQWTDEESQDYKVTTTRVNMTNTVEFSLTKANIWSVNYYQDFIYANPISTNTNNSKKLEDKNYNNEPDLVTNMDTHDHAANLQKNLREQYLESYKYVHVNLDSVNEEIYNATINQNKNTTNTIETKQYSSSPGKTEEKSDPNSKEDNFVTILRKSKYKNAKDKIMEVSSWLFEILEENDSTKDMVDLTKYLLNKVVEKEVFKDIDINFDSLYSPKNTSNSSSINDFDVSDSSLFITDVNKLKEAFKGYSNSDKLVEYAQDFINMQNKYKVNALFAAAVSITETGAGNQGNAIKIADSSNSVNAINGQCWNNWFNLKETDSLKPYGILHSEEGESHYKIFESVTNAIDSFGYNIANGSYYYEEGKRTVDSIGHTYCPNSKNYPTQGDDWVKNTLTLISNFYTLAGMEPNSSQSGSFVQYYQNDYPNVAYGDGNLLQNGCGPTSFSMIASTLAGKRITPAEAVSWCGNTYYVIGSGTSWTYFAAAASHFKLNVSVKPTSNINEVVNALQSGKYIISSQGPGLFTTGGHFIVLSAIDSNNNITVKDPNKENAVTKGYNNRKFTINEINQSAKQYWIFN